MRIRVHSNPRRTSAVDMEGDATIFRDRIWRNVGAVIKIRNQAVLEMQENTDEEKHENQSLLCQRPLLLPGVSS